MNYSDSERMEAYLKALDLEKVDSFEKADIIIFNTCSIKQKAEDKVFGHLKEVGRINRLAKDKKLVVITGCMVRKSSSRYSEERDKLFVRIKELDIALRIEELPVLANLIREVQPENKIKGIKEEELEDYFDITPTHDTYQSKAQAFVAISNGCDKFCTYCIVPYSRGREKSRKLDEIISEATKLVENGCKEIILIGQTVNSYGLSNYDNEQKTFEEYETTEPFVYLLEEMDKLSSKGLERVRFTSPHPKDMSDKLISAMAVLKTQMPYLHLPVQAGNDEVLKRMNRPYTVEKVREVIKKLRDKMPDISISTDIIVGFCGETDAEYKDTCDFFKEMGFEHAYISQYSERKGTTAQKFIKDDVPTATKKKRWHHLNEILKTNSKKTLEGMVGKEFTVLVETQDGKLCTGRNENFKTIQFNSGRTLVGEMVKVRTTKSEDWILKGELV